MRSAADDQGGGSVDEGLVVLMGHARRSREPTVSPDRTPGAPNAARGVVIVVVAGLVGLFLLYRGGSSGVLASSEPAPAHATTTVANVPTIPAPTTTAPPPSTSPPAQVSVAIFNATGGKVPGAAGDNRNKLTPLGYSQVTINDSTPVPKTAVYYAKGSKGDALAIAKALGYHASVVAPSSGAKSLPPGAQNAAVVVIIGQDAPSGTG